MDFGRPQELINLFIQMEVKEMNALALRKHLFTIVEVLEKGLKLIG